MGKSAPSPPTPPDPQVVAAAQTGSNVTTGVANSIMGNANVYGPTGSTTSTISEWVDVTNPENGDVYPVPKYTLTNTLSPEQQSLYNQQTQLGGQLNQLAIDQTGRISGLLGQPMDMSSLSARGTMPQSGPNLQGFGPGAPIMGGTPVQLAQGGVMGSPIQQQVNLQNQSGQIGYAGDVSRTVGLGNQGTSFGPTSTNVQTSVGPQDWSADRTRVEEAIYGRMNPQLARDKEALESNLVNQGFQRGTTAFNEAMDASNRQANDARMQAVIAGGAEQSRLAGLDLAQGNFANQAQMQEYGQQMGRGQFYNTATAANNQARLAEGQFWNAAQGQVFGQNQAAMQAANAATAANNQARLAEGTFGRESQAQDYTQAMAGQQLNNAAAQQNTAAMMAANQFYNAAQQQGFDQTMAGGQANNAVAQQMFGNNLQLMGAQNAQRQAEMQEMLAQRNQPINEITALMGGGQVSMPQFQNYQPSQIAGTPVGEYYYQTDAANRSNYNTQVQFEAAQMQGMYGLAGGLLGGMMRFSDRRLKTDIVDMGVKLINGIKLYSYRLFGDLEVGVMADEVLNVKPDAVYLTPSGFLAVDYGEIV
jgi:hypothetical protein